jgi:RNA 3'-terminal phosphate cyclase (ATP)
VIQIDGSRGEGGGQVVRTAVSLAAVTGLAAEIVRVRDRRQRPGLQPQHLAAVRAAATICDATLVGAEIGSSRLIFEPGRAPHAGEYIFDIRTAGATTLVLQTVLIPLLHAEGQSSVEVIGGTYQPMSPSADYLQRVYIPALKRFGVDVEVEHGPAGYYPRGGGRLRAIVKGGPLKAVQLVARGARRSLDAIVVTSRLGEQVAERASATISSIVPDAAIHVSRPTAFSPGAAVTVVADHEGGLAGFSAIGRRGWPMEEVAAEACRLFKDWDASGAACDEHLADQLVLPASLATGTSRWTTPVVTEHLTTVLEIVDAFIPITRTLTDELVEISAP